MAVLVPEYTKGVGARAPALLGYLAREPVMWSKFATVVIVVVAVAFILMALIA